MGEDFAEGVVRRVDQWDFCLFVDGLLQLFEIYIPDVLISSYDLSIVGFYSLFELSLGLGGTGAERETNGFSSSHLDLGAVAVIRGVEENNLVSWIYDPQKTAEEGFRSTVSSNDVVEGIYFDWEVGLVELGDCLHKSDGSIRAHILVTACIR